MVKLVNTATGEEVDLRFVSDLRITGLPAELLDEFKELEQQRRRWQEYIGGALGVPADVVLGVLTTHAPA